MDFVVIDHILKFFFINSEHFRVDLIARLEFHLSIFYFNELFQLCEARLRKSHAKMEVEKSIRL